MRPAVETLRRHLIRAALLPALVVVAASAVFDYLGDVELAQQAQDSVLYKTAVALATRLSPDETGESQADLLRHLQPEDAAMLRSDSGDVIHFLVLEADGSVLLGDKELLTLASLQPQSTAQQPVFADRVLGREPVRVVDLVHTSRNTTHRVIVSETNHKRTATTRRILVNTLWPNLLLLVLMLLLLQRGIHKSLVPLRSVSAAIDRREGMDLTPIPLEQVPGEIRPLVGAINGMLERLEKSTAEQQIFLSGAAHQLRTPLAGIQTQLELAAREAAPPVRARLDRVHEAINRLAHCTQQMLALARSSAQASNQLQFAPVDFTVLLEEAASTWLDIALKHGSELEFEVEPAHCTGSKWMLQELLGNLIDNAIKHSPQGGRVWARCGTTGEGQPYLEVQDQGPGIPPAQRAQVFEPFFRQAVDSSTGAGLGLAIVREVADRHRAAIEFREMPVGTCIRLVFPVRHKELL